MAPDFTINFPLREILRAILRNSHTPAQHRQFIALCHAMALVRLERKASLGQLHPCIIESSISDLAFDCIAEMFRENEDAIPVQIQAYFSSIDLGTTSDQQILVFLRRLVFNVVNISLFRIYNEIDPALGRIIRNIKLSVGSLGTFEESELFGDTLLAPVYCDPLVHLPMMERDALTKLLYTLQIHDDRVPTMLSALSRHLREQREYSRRVPLITIAVAYRDYLAYFQQHLPDETNAAERILDESDHADLLKRSVGTVRRRMYSHYVEGEGIDEQTYSQFFSIIEEKLKGEFEGDGNEISLRDAAIGRIPSLSAEEYYSRHRNTLEYLLRLSRREVRKQIVRDLE